MASFGHPLTALVGACCALTMQIGQSSVESVPPGFTWQTNHQVLNLRSLAAGRPESGRGSSNRSGLALSGQTCGKGSPSSSNGWIHAVSDETPRNPPTPCGAAGSPPPRAPSWRRSTPPSGSTGAWRSRISQGLIAHSAMLADRESSPQADRDAIHARVATGARGDRIRPLHLLDRAGRHPHERREPPDRRSSASPADGYIRRGAATIRWRSTSACGSATRTTARMRN